MFKMKAYQRQNRKSDLIILAETNATFPSATNENYIEEFFFFVLLIEVICQLGSTTEFAGLIASLNKIKYWRRNVYHLCAH